MTRHAASEQNPERRTEINVQLGELLELQVQDTQGALRAYQQALTFDPSSKPALAALDRLYRRSEMWEPLIDVLQRRGALETEDADAIRYHLEVGQTYDSKLGDSNRAVPAYQSALQLDPGNLQALRALEHLYEKNGQSEKYLEVLELQLDASPSDAERVSLYERMAAAWEERFGKLDRAAEAYEKIVALDSRNFNAYRELARLYQLAGRGDAPLLDQDGAVLDEPSRRLAGDGRVVDEGQDAPADDTRRHVRMSSRRKAAMRSISASAVRVSASSSFPSRRSKAAMISALSRPLTAMMKGMPKRAR